MLLIDTYFRVSAVAEMSDSADSGSYSRMWFRPRRKKSTEFDSIFRVACDELKEESGSTHQTMGMPIKGMQ